MTRIPRSWQGLGLLLGLVFSTPLISGQGCVTQPPSVSNLDTSQENTSGQTNLPNEANIPDATVTTPLVQVLFPNGGEQIEQGSIVATRVFARHNSIPDPTLRVFYDTDNNPANGNTTIATIKASIGGAGWDTRGVALGNYYVGVEMVGVTPAVIDYSNASFTIVPAGTSGGDGGGNNGGGGGGGGGGVIGEIQLTVNTPRSAVSRFEGDLYTIQWSTSLLPNQGTATVFREADLNKDKKPDGAAFRDTIGSPGIDAAQSTLKFDTTGVIGTFFIGVTVSTPDGKTVTAYSKGTLTVAPRLFWVGDLGTKRDSNNQVIAQTGSFQGAVLRGFTFQDNLGSAMVATDDYESPHPLLDEFGNPVLDDSGNPVYSDVQYNGILVAAQFAKPFNYASEGRGSGEAYLIYGSSKRLSGDYEVNNAGQPSLPGLIFTGILPNPYGNSDIGGNKYAYTVDGLPTTGYQTEGLRSLTLIPDQDGDDKREIVFGFPWCDSWSLASMVDYGLDPTPFPSAGFLENDGHFLRGGLVIVSSRNSQLQDRCALSRHYDRTMLLNEVGQLFHDICNPYVGRADFCPFVEMGLYAKLDAVTYPFDGFWQTTGGSSSDSYGGRIDPPRLANPQQARDLAIPPDYSCRQVLIDINQVDSPPIPTSEYFIYGRYSGLPTTDGNYCKQDFPLKPYPDLNVMEIMGTGFWVKNNCANPAFELQSFADPMEPYGCRILGQTTTQLNTNPPTTANRFGASVSVSNDFLAIGAPMRTALRRDVVQLPSPDRYQSGEVYLLQMRRHPCPECSYKGVSSPETEVPWRYQGSATSTTGDAAPINYSMAIPQPHNYIIDDVGYTRFLDKDTGHTLTSAGTPDCGWTLLTGPGYVRYEMDNPTRIVGAAPQDRIGESVAGLYDINHDGVDDVAVGGPGTNTGRGAVYIIYRRQPATEGDYLLERIQLAPSAPNRLTGMMIIGEQGENLGTSIAGLGPAQYKDDYNGDGFSDVLIGSPNAVTANGYESGKAFILFGGKTLLNSEGGTTIPQLVASGDGVVLLGAQAGDRAGETVSCAGDVNGDGIVDFLISAPKATVPDLKYVKPGTGDNPVYLSLRVAMQYDSNGDEVVDTPGIGIDRDGDGKADALNPNDVKDADGNIIYTAADDLTDAGVVYLVYGGKHLKGTISLSKIGTAALPGFVFVGRAAGNELGAGHTLNGLLSKGLSYAGDLDADGYGDLMISSILADPEGKTNAGEVYVVYGFAP